MKLETYQMRLFRTIGTWLLIATVALATIAPLPAQGDETPDDPGVLIRIDLPRGRESLDALDRWIDVNLAMPERAATYTDRWDAWLSAAVSVPDAAAESPVDQAAGTTILVLDPTRTADPWLTFLEPVDADHAALDVALRAKDRLARRVGHRIATTTSIRTLDRGIARMGDAPQPQYTRDEDVLVVTVYLSEWIARLRRQLIETIPPRLVEWSRGRYSAPARFLGDLPLASYTLGRAFDLAEQTASVELRLRAPVDGDPREMVTDWSWEVAIRPLPGTALQRWADWSPDHDNSALTRLGIPYSIAEDGDRVWLLWAELPWRQVGEGLAQWAADGASLPGLVEDLPIGLMSEVRHTESTLTGPIVLEERDHRIGGHIPVLSAWFPVEDEAMGDHVVSVASQLGLLASNDMLTGPLPAFSFESELTLPDSSAATLVADMLTAEDESRIGVLLAMALDPPRGFLARYWVEQREREAEESLLVTTTSTLSDAPKLQLPGESSTPQALRIALVGSSPMLGTLLPVNFSGVVDELRLSAFGGDGQIRLDLRPEPKIRP